MVNDTKWKTQQLLYLSEQVLSSPSERLSVAVWYPAAVQGLCRCSLSVVQLYRVARSAGEFLDMHSYQQWSLTFC